MSIEFRCPNCEKKLRTADDKAGKAAKCPQCGTAVVVPSANAADDGFEDFRDFGDIEDRTSPPPIPGGRRTQSVRHAEITCPVCGAINDANAPQCLSCGEELGDARAAAGHLPSLRFGEIWASAWEKWSANLGISVGSILIAFLILMVGYMALIFVIVLGVGLAGAAGGNQAGAGMIAMFAAMAVGYLAILILVMYLQLGLSNFALNMARTRQGNLTDMFPPIHKLPAAAVCMFAIFCVMLVAMAPGIAAQFGGQAMMMNDNKAGIGLALAGYVLQFAASLLVQSAFWPVPYMIADRRAGLFAALVDGPKLAVYNWKLSLLLALVNLGLSLLGSLACVIGLLFTYSLSFLLFAVAYDRLKRHVHLEPSST